LRSGAPRAASGCKPLFDHKLCSFPVRCTKSVRDQKLPIP
jgi:hypothetical protein